ncbi:hypothetical protein M413DRAFT_447619 [Hebeloma cylindrosporum]|uniref:Uncharacterized protein n=1 Tax=Hebeloma cylindrosporum TaxID=76867 RepID=A0A0C3BPU6_HEBCY|nr:hypothetical protein M413DRAFT_447619 [Hebeloma cylindrosporum h7]
MPDLGPPMPISVTWDGPQRCGMVEQDGPRADAYDRMQYEENEKQNRGTLLPQNKPARILYTERPRSWLTARRE